MKNYQFISHNETDTKNFAKNLAKICKSKDIIVLTDDLGSGKQNSQKIFYHILI